MGCGGSSRYWEPHEPVLNLCLQIKHGFYCHVIHQRSWKTFPCSTSQDSRKVSNPLGVNEANPSSGSFRRVEKKKHQRISCQQQHTRRKINQNSPKTFRIKYFSTGSRVHRPRHSKIVVHVSFHFRQYSSRSRSYTS